jgi:hypothetical protein
VKLKIYIPEGKDQEKLLNTINKHKSLCFPYKKNLQFETYLQEKEFIAKAIGKPLNSQCYWEAVSYPFIFIVVQANCMTGPALTIAAFPVSVKIWQNWPPSLDD